MGGFGMSPYEIGILLHYYGTMHDHPDMMSNPPIWRPTIDRFIGEDLIRANTDDSVDRRYALTARGEFFVTHGLCELEPPRQEWVMVVQK
jgi:hypothetical protein